MKVHLKDYDHSDSRYRFVLEVCTVAARYAFSVVERAHTQLSEPIDHTYGPPTNLCEQEDYPPTSLIWQQVEWECVFECEVTPHHDQGEYQLFYWIKFRQDITLAYGILRVHTNLKTYRAADQSSCRSAIARYNDLVIEETQVTDAEPGWCEDLKERTETYLTPIYVGANTLSSIECTDV